MKIKIETVRGGYDLIEFICEELEINGRLKTDSNIVEVLRKLEFIPQYPRAEFYKKVEKE